MTEFQKTAKNKVIRAPKRAVYDKEKIYEILDQNFLCHIAFVHNDIPVIIPTSYGRKDDVLYIHGSSASRMIKHLEQGEAISVAITEVNALVLARSLFHHSMNYKSVVVFGTGTLVTDETEKMEALKIISDNIIEDRWEEARYPNAKEMKATKIIAISLAEASAKIREGAPSDDKADYNTDFWAGNIPLKTIALSAEVDNQLNPMIDTPKSVTNYIKKHS